MAKSSIEFYMLNEVVGATLSEGFLACFISMQIAENDW